MPQQLMSFLNPLYFWGALAAAVPVLLHLIRRERARRIEFPTLMYLRKVSKRTIRYQKLRHLLLLLLRVLAFLFLALAFTRPFREMPQVSAAGGKVTTAHIILLDNSLSMSYGDRWERAKKAAAEIVRRASVGDKFALLEFSDRVFARSQIVTGKDTLLGQIENGVELTEKSTRYSQALRLAEKLALEAGAEKRIIYLISDFQKSGLDADEQDSRLSSSVELKPVDLGSDSFSNLTFGEVKVLDADESNAGSFQIKATVVNYGTEDRKNIRVSLSLDGRVVAEKAVDADRSALRGVEFQIPALTAGAHPVVLEVEDPNLTRDNRFSMILEARGKTPVFSVENPEPKGGRSPSFFLSHALNVSSFSPYRLTAVALEKAESVSTLTGSLVIWNDASGGGPALQKKLQDYVRGGGGLAVVLGKAVTAEDFNRTFGSWVPVQMEDPSLQAKRPGQASHDYALLTDLRMDHPIFKPFSEPHSGDFTGAKFFKYARLKAAQGSEVLARFDNGLPAVVSANIDKGRVVVLAFPADDSGNNDFPVKAVFAPLWQQILRHLGNLREGRRWVEVGETIEPQKILAESALRQGRADFDLNQAIVVMSPDKRRVPAAPGASALTLEKIGLYEIRSPRLSITVAVNPVPKESDLAHANVEEFVAGWLPREASGAPQPAVENERMSLEEQERKQRLWRLLLAAVLVFLVSEGLLGNRLALKRE